MKLTCGEFIRAINSFWEDHICKDKDDDEEKPKAAGADLDASNQKGNPKGNPKGKGAKGQKGKGAGGKTGSRAKGKGNYQGWWNSNQGGGGRGLGSNAVSGDDDRCQWTCPICGPTTSVQDWMPGRMHFPDQCPIRLQVRTAYTENKNNDRKIRKFGF